MSDTCIDIKSWLGRAESFVRQLNYLPGGWGIAVEIEPPVSAEQADELAAELPLGLPAPLRSLYVDGAAAFKSTYYWKPNVDSLPKIQEVFPYQSTLMGGPDFIPFHELKNAHSIHEWCDCFPNADTPEMKRAIDVWHNTVPIIALGNGDAVGLHINRKLNSREVVFLCHDEPEDSVTFLSPSFGQFLADWECALYAGPETRFLSAFFDVNIPHKGLNAKHARVELLRETFQKLRGG